MEKIITRKKVVLTKREAFEAIASFDWAELAKEQNGNVVVSAGRKRYFWSMETLLACKKGKGLVPASALLLAHCEAFGKEYPEADEMYGLCIVERDVSPDEAIEDTLTKNNKTTQHGKSK